MNEITERRNRIAAERRAKANAKRKPREPEPSPQRRVPSKKSDGVDPLVVAAAAIFLLGD